MQVMVNRLEEAVSAKFDPPAFDALDECHRQIQVHLHKLSALAEHIAEQGIDDQARKEAAVIESFFSTTSRQHHKDEEVNVFPGLLASGDAALVQSVKALQQDHGWIEENWLELAPRMRAIASGNGWLDETEFLNYVEVFLDILNGHIALEESLIYPESKAQWAQAVQARVKRLEAH